MTTPKKPAPMDMESVLALAKPRETVLRLCLDGHLAAEAERLGAALDRLPAFTPSSLADADPRAGLAAELDKVIAKMASAEVEFTFRSLPRLEFSDLKAAHPPLDDKTNFNVETLQIELVARACVSPVMTLEQADALFDVVNEAGRAELFNAAWTANQIATRIPTSRAVSVNPSSSGAR